MSIPQELPPSIQFTMKADCGEKIRLTMVRNEDDTYTIKEVKVLKEPTRSTIDPVEK